jgi:hypothetical protein
MEYARTIPDSISKELKRRTSAISRHDASEFCETIAPSDHQRAQGMPGAQCTRSLVCTGVVGVCTRVFTAEAPDTSGIPHAMVLRLISRSPRGTGSFAPVVSQGVTPQTLAPASGRQDHTTSPSASGSPVKRAARVHRIPLRVRDVAQRPSVGRDQIAIVLIWGWRQEKILKIGNLMGGLKILSARRGGLAPA